MDNFDIDEILERNKIKKDIINYIKLIETQNDLILKKGFYIYGNSGVGKTEFIKRILKSLNYDILYYDASDVRNKQMIENITKDNLGDKNIISMFNKKVKKMAIIMDEIDGMSTSDKGGLATLTKLIRPKKTKKQKTENYSINPIFCIGNYHVDKKIKELMKVTYNFELKKPTTNQLYFLLNKLMPKIEKDLLPELIKYIDGDLRKVNMLYNIYKKQHHILKNELLTNIFQVKINNDYTKDTIRTLMNTKISSNEHNLLMNETDRTSIGLLYHENIIDGIKHNYKIKEGIKLYYDILENYTFCDYLDRVTFQKQIWLYNEISSLIKIIENNQKYHDNINKKKIYNPKEVRFTKILTKYSTEYNNLLFIHEICQKLSLDKKDVFSYFLNLRNTMNEDEIIQYLENFEIHKLDIERIFRYIDKYTLGE